MLHSWYWYCNCNEICKIAKVDIDKRVQDLSEKQISSIREVISSLEINVEGELRSYNAMNIKEAQRCWCLQGLRHRRGLPAMGKELKQMQELVRVKRELLVWEKSYITKNLR